MPRLTLKAAITVALDENISRIVASARILIRDELDAAVPRLYIDILSTSPWAIIKQE